jgi:hypothetical protein
MKISQTRYLICELFGAKLLLIGITYQIFAFQGLAISIESSISALNPYAYASNAGWINFRPTSEHGTQIRENFLSGYAYSGNFGWINLGNGTPENGYSYSNNSPSDFGVNLADDGSLSGYAYAPNVGWITFEAHRGQPRLNFSTGKLSGYAYSGNLGWISLDTEFSDLVASYIVQPADSDEDGIPDPWEMQKFGNLTTADALTDSDLDGVGDLNEYIAGTNPMDSNSLFRIVSHSYDAYNSTATITFTSVPNRLYLIERDDDLLGSWSDSGHGLVSNDSGSFITKTFIYPNSNKQFFRVNAKKPLQQ